MMSVVWPPRDASRTHFMSFSASVKLCFTPLNLTVSLRTERFEPDTGARCVQVLRVVYQSGEGRPPGKPQPHICSGKAHNSHKMAQFEDRAEEQLSPSVPHSSNLQKHVTMNSCRVSPKFSMI